MRSICVLLLAVALLTTSCSDKDEATNDSAVNAPDQQLKQWLDGPIADAHPTPDGPSQDADVKEASLADVAPADAIPADAPLADLGPQKYWATSAGGSTFDMGWEIGRDAAGSLYVVGLYTTAATFGATKLISKASFLPTIFVAKLSGWGKWLWAKGIDSTSMSGTKSIAVDSSGNSYVTGMYSGTTGFGALSLTAKGKSDLFVAKLDSAGKFLWVTSVHTPVDHLTAGGGAVEMATDIAVDSKGNTYITGLVYYTATFGSIVVTSPWTHGRSVFVAKLDSTGKFLWVSTWGSKQTTTYPDNGINGVAVDSSGNVHVTGVFVDTASFGSKSLTSKGSGDMFVAKLDSAGKWLWATGAGSPAGLDPADHDVGNDIVVDSSGKAHVTGWFRDKATFGATTLTAKVERSVFIARLDSAGKFLWATAPTKAFDVVGNGIAIDSAGNTHVAGSHYGPVTFGTTTLVAKSWSAFVAKLDSAGKFLSVATPGGGEARGVVVDAAGDRYVTGSFSGSLTFGTTPLTSQGAIDVFVWKTK